MEIDRSVRLGNLYLGNAISLAPGRTKLASLCHLAILEPGQSGVPVTANMYFDVLVTTNE